MAEKRVITRQESITAEVASVKHEFEARPLFWRDRLDFGTLIGSEYSKASAPMTPRIVTDEDGSGSHLDYQFVDRDYVALLHAGYPADKGLKNGMIDKLDLWEMVELIKVAMEVNGLDRLYYMVDPRLKDPLTLALENAMGQDAGPKTPSSTDVSLLESIPTLSSDETAESG